MKCPQCGFNQRVKSGMTCKKCNYRFSLNPKEKANLGMTDGKFLACIKRAGRNGAMHFTENQLYAAYLGNKNQVSFGGLLVALVFLLVGVVICAFKPVLGIIVAVIGFFGIAMTILNYYRSYALKLNQFRNCIELWKRDGKSIDGLLTVPALSLPPPQWSEQDIYDYGVERILIVNRDLLVDLFVKNNQHSEQRMLVISETGYPQYLKPMVTRLLEQRDDLPVFLLHDADKYGTGMRQRVQHLDWLPIRQHPLIDLGFFPQDFEQIERAKLFNSKADSLLMPADALLMGSLTLGLAACFASQITIGEELKREAENSMSSGSSFG